MTALPRAFFLKAAPGQRLCLYHEPAASAAARGRILYFHPFAEELNTTRRVVARQARALANMGFAVLQIDLLGCGDSSGDFAEASWDAWCTDALAAHAWLAQHAEGPLWLWGVRAGALLAGHTAATLPEAANMLLWQPVLHGRHMLQQFLRLHSAGEWVAGRSGTGSESASASEKLLSGQAIEIAGYSLSTELVQGLSSARLTPPAQVTGKLVWLEVGSSVLGLAAEREIGNWRSAGWQVQAGAQPGPPFWLQYDTEALPEVEAATLDALNFS